MFILGNLLNAIAALIGTFAQIYVFVLVGHVICSWVGADRFNPIVRFIYLVTEPFLQRIRRFIPPVGGLDFSVLVAILIVQLGVQAFLVSTLVDLAHRLR